MKKWLDRFYRNRHFLAFIFLFAYAQSVYTRISIRQEVNAYTFTPDAALSTLFMAGVLFLIMHSFIKKWQKSGIFSAQEMLKIFGSSLIMFLLTMKIIGFFIAFMFGNIERNFNKETFIFSTLFDFLNGFIYGGFILVYYYYNKSKSHQQQVTNYSLALAESKIHQLKSQINPHFLFNNLNVLDQLIEEDKQKASNFLNEFAEIYRYVLQASDKTLVPLNEELSFAELYFRLVQHKYGTAYQLNTECKSANGYIVPMTLQLLIENAIQHNLGTEENPIYINITQIEDIRVSNNINLKKNPKTTYGRALNNIKEQYKLLTQKPVEIHQTNSTFSVIIPSILR